MHKADWWEQRKTGSCWGLWSPTSWKDMRQKKNITSLTKKTGTGQKRNKSLRVTKEKNVESSNRLYSDGTMYRLRDDLAQRRGDH